MPLHGTGKGQGSAEIPSGNELGPADPGLAEIRQAVADLTVRVERIEAVRTVP